MQSFAGKEIFAGTIFIHIQYYHHIPEDATPFVQGKRRGNPVKAAEKETVGKMNGSVLAEEIGI